MKMEETDIDTDTNDVSAEEIKDLIQYIRDKGTKNRTWLSYTQLKAITQGKFKRPKVWSSTHTVV